jgi:hypothetical protein
VFLNGQIVYYSKLTPSKAIVYEAKVLSVGRDIVFLSCKSDVINLRSLQFNKVYTTEWESEKSRNFI